MKTRMGMGNGDVDMAATTGEKKRELVWEGACKRTTGGTTENERANKTIRKSKSRTKKLTSFF